MKRKIINYEELEEAMTKFEELLEPYDMIETNIIISQVNSRRIKKQQQMNVNENLHGIDFKSVLGNIMKGNKKKDDEVY